MLNIDGTEVGDSTPCYVIAEIGHNHQGDLEKARQMFREAKECGANAVKLQKRDNRSLFTRELYDKPYENENSFGPTYGAHREALEFGRREYEELQRYTREIGITMFATAFDIPSADFLAELDMPVYKLASGDLTNIPLIRHVAAFQKPVILSTGGGTLDDIRRAHDAFVEINPQLCLLQCTATYPTQPGELNLRVIAALREEFPEVVVGLSDHFNGITMAVSAFVLGARVIEKHFTLNHTMKGTDHALSLEPIGMSKMVRDLHRTREALGDGVKRVLPSEVPALVKMAKSLYAARDLPAGHVLSAKDIAIKSPGGGLPPYRIDEVIGSTLSKSVRVDEPLTAAIVGLGAEAVGRKAPGAPRVPAGARRRA
jgi:N-acetylneuraminate synthase/sialic acid synthase